MKIEITLDSQVQATLQRFLRTAGNTDESTHGPLTIAALIEMLLEDVALMMTRPGCWEANAMAGLLGGHGYV
jgi:hypothetical protein